MSVTAIRWAYAQHCGSLAAKAVLVKLADNACDDGVAWPSMSSIATETELSRRGVIKAIKHLEERGLLTVFRHKTGGVSDRNKYRLNLSNTASNSVNTDAGGSEPSSPRVVNTVHQGGEPSAQGVVNPVHTNHQLEPPLNHQKGRGARETVPRGKAPNTELPTDWTLPDNSRAYAAEQGLEDAEIDRIRDDFSDYHCAKGSRFRDWHRAWCRWVRNEIKWSAERRGKAHPGPSGGERSSGGAYVDAYRRVYGSGDGGGSDRGPDDGAVAPGDRDVPDPGQSAKSEGGVVIELFRGKGGADVRGHDGPAQVQQRRPGQGGRPVEGDCIQAVAVPGSGGWGCAGGMGGTRGVASGMGGPEAASGPGLQDPSGIDFSNGASE